MKIALIHSLIGGPSGGGGGVRQMLDLGRALDQLGHEVTLCAYAYERETAFTSDDEPFEIRSVRADMVPPPSSFLDAQKQIWSTAPAVAKLVPDDVDVINAHEMPGHLMGRAAARRLDRPWIWTRNDPSYYEYLEMPEEFLRPPPSAAARISGRLLNRTDLLAGRGADAVAVLDNRNARMVRQVYGRDATVVRSGPAGKFFEPPDRETSRSELGVADDEFLITALGILMPYRRFEDLIEAIARLRGRLPEGRRARAILVGADTLSPDYAADLRELHGRLGIGGICELRFESVSEQTLRGLYSGADAFVFPNDKQTWGLAPLEAIASGTPVVVSRGAGVHEVLEGFEGAELVDPHSPDQIADALARMAAAPRADVSAAREWIRRELSGTAFAQNMADLMADVSR